MSLKFVKTCLTSILPQRMVWLISRWLYTIGYHKPFLWDISQSERVVEYAWAFKNLDIEKGRILDVGSCGSLFSMSLASLGFEVWGVDKKQDNHLQHPGFRLVQGNILDVNLPEDYFDLVTVISTVEHIGLSDDGDFKCMKLIYQLIKPGGKAIVTAPFGNPATFAGYRVYDMVRIRRMWPGSIKKIHFFMKDDRGKWRSVEEQAAAGVVMQNRGECKSIFCAVLEK